MKSPDLRRLFAGLARPSLRPLFSIPSHLTDREKLVLYKLARITSTSRPQGARLVEIGSYLGASSCFLAAGLQKPDDQVLCIDTWQNDAMSEGARDTMAAFERNIARYRNLLHPIRGWSHDPEVLRLVSSCSEMIDLLFIDGDHSYEGVLRDWRLYSPLLGSRSFVVLHDVGWAPGVQRVIKEEVLSRVGWHRRLPNLWWGQVDS